MARNGLIHAMVLSGDRTGRSISWDEVTNWRPDDGILWVHLDRKTAGAKRWTTDQGDVDPLLLPSLLDEETRPRCAAHADGLLLILRGVNATPGDRPEDMVAVRLWIRPWRIISLRHRRLGAVRDVRQALETGRGPHDVGAFVGEIVERLLDRMHPIVYALDDQIGALEERLFAGEDEEAVGASLSALRRRVVGLRRHMAPQRDALCRLPQLEVPWLSEKDRRRLQEAGERLTRFVEELDVVRDRAGIANDELASRAAARSEKPIYLLSVIAGIFLPLGFVTGLLGMNVGGLPGQDSPWAFVAILLALIVAGISLSAVFRRLKWL